MEFKNYLALCNYFGLKPNSGNSRICQLNKIGKEYRIEKIGNKFILTEKEKGEMKRDRILSVLNNSEGNSYYLKNNFIIYIYKLKQVENHIYEVYNVQQMRDFGFLRKGLKPTYIYNTFVYQDPVYNITKEFEEKLTDILSKTTEKKEVKEVVGEVYRILHDRYTKLMNTALFSLVSANKYFDVSAAYSQGEWKKFMSHFRRSLNVLSKEVKLVGISEGKSGKEFVLEGNTLYDYLEIRNDVFAETGFSGVDYESSLKMRNVVYSKIQDRCKEKLGIQVVYKKLFYGLIGNLDDFNITQEQYEEARKANNERMKGTLTNYFTKKYARDSVLAKAYAEAVAYIMDIYAE